MCPGCNLEAGLGQAAASQFSYGQGWQLSLSECQALSRMLEFRHYPTLNEMILGAWNISSQGGLHVTNLSSNIQNNPKM